MGVIDTRKWIDEIYFPENNSRNKFTNVIEKQLMKHLKKLKREEWLGFLYQQGMLPIDERTVNDWKEWAENCLYEEISDKFAMLQELFDGPDVDVFLFPINDENSKLMETMRGKNGVTFPGLILLFFHAELDIKEIYALLIHEYHHACRLNYQKYTEDTIPLLESIVMEGLAEWEVNRLMGESYVTPWMTLYDDALLLNWWKQKIDIKQKLLGRKSQLIYLYGGKFGYPNWLGYTIGYRMVESSLENSADILHPKQLLRKKSEEILRESVFYKDISSLE